jgi:predicted metal-dependent HD superfamily phosphohydrolase
MILSHHSEEHRHYHTLVHLGHLLSLSRDAASRHVVRRPDIIDWAIVFHDIVYDPKSKTNEEDSADLFRITMQDALPKSDVDLIFEYINQTKAHDVGGSDDEDLKYFIDWDMSVLGSVDDEYDIYVGKVRQEYIHVSEQDWKTNRGAFLKSVVSGDNEQQKKFIFAHEVVRGQLEEQAMKNMERELATLCELISA